MPKAKSPLSSHLEGYSEQEACIELLRILVSPITADTIDLRDGAIAEARRLLGITVHQHPSKLRKVRVVPHAPRHTPRPTKPIYGFHHPHHLPHP